MSRTKVFSVNSVQLTKTSETGHIHVQALGSANTSDWKDPELIDTPQPQRMAISTSPSSPPPPTGITSQVITPTSAKRTLQGHAGNQCIVVHSASGSIKEFIDIQIGDTR